jgi:hypothetical protein
VKNSTSKETLRFTNDKLLAGLRKLGVATQSEVNALKFKIQDLEAELKNSNSAMHSKEMSSQRED